MTKTIIYLLAFIMFLPSVMAQGNRLYNLPEVQSLPLQTYAAESRKVEKTFSNDSFVAFTMDLPTVFKEQSGDILKQYEDDDRLYGELYRAHGEIFEDVYPYFSLKAYPLSRYISAKNWFVAELLSKGHTLRAITATKDDNKFEALYVRFDTLGNTEIVRVKGYLKGRRILMAEYVVPARLWNAQQDYQTYAIKSFDMKGRSDNQQPEGLNTFKFLETFSFKYPQSWRIVEEQKDLENRVDVSLLTTDDLKVVFAHLDITLASDQSLRDSLDRSRYDMKLPQIIMDRKQGVLDKGYLIDDVMERRTYDISVPHDLQLTEVYPLRRKISDYQTHRQAAVSHEFWVTAIKGTEETGKNYIVSMLIPSRQANIYQWAYAVKVYELMLRSIR